MKKMLYILTIIVVLIILGNDLQSSEFVSFEMNSDLLNSIEVSEEHTLIDGNKHTILLHNSSNNTFKEYYIGEHNRVKSALLKDNLLYLSDLNSLTVVNLDNNSYLVDTNAKNINLLFSSNNDLYAATNEDSLYSLSIDFNNKKFNLNYTVNSKEINFKIINDENKYFINASGEVYTFSDTLNSFKEINLEGNILDVKVIDEYIYLLYNNFFAVFDDDFNFLQNVSVGNHIYTISDYDSYYTINFSGNTLIFQNYTFGNDKIQEQSYSFDWDLDIQSFNSIFSNKENVFALGNNKTIIEYNTNNQIISIESATNFIGSSNFGDISFFNESIGGYATINGLVFNTTNSGATWKPIEKSDHMRKNVHDFNTIEYLDDSTFISFSNSVDGTIYSKDNGNSFIHTFNPSNGNPYALTFTEKFNSAIYFARSYFGVGVGQGLYYSKNDDKLNILKDTFLVGYTHKKTVSVNNRLYSLVDEQENMSFPNSIIITDTNLKSFEKKDFFDEYALILDFEVMNDEIYYLAVDEVDREKKYLLKSNLNIEKLEKVKEFKAEFYNNIYKHDDELILSDTSGNLFKYNYSNNDITKILDLGKTNFSRTRFEYKDSTIFSRYENKFEKHVLIPPFRNPKTNVIDVIQPLYASKPYPNPALDYIKVRINYDQSYTFDKEMISLYNLNGNAIDNGFRIKLNSLNNYTLEIELTSLTLESGIYFLKVELGTKLQPVPFIIE